MTPENLLWSEGGVRPERTALSVSILSKEGQMANANYHEDEIYVECVGL